MDATQAVWAALAKLTFDETLELAETFRDAWESTDIDGSIISDWMILLKSARDIAEDRLEDA